MSDWESAWRDIASWNKEADGLQTTVRQALENLDQSQRAADATIKLIGEQAVLTIQRLAELNALAAADGQQNEARRVRQVEQVRLIQVWQEQLEEDLSAWMATTHQSIATTLAYTTPALRGEKEVLDLIAKVRAEVQAKSTVNQQQVALANWLQGWAAFIDEEERRLEKHQDLSPESQEPKKEHEAPQASTVSGQPRQAHRSREEEGNLP